jgi:hypothetical protein
MAYSKSRLSAATPAVANRFVVSTNMINGAYTVANATMPTTPGARRVTVTHATVAVGTDTLGTITVTGTDLRGATITDVIVPVADSTATGVKFFKTVTGVVGAGWVIAGGNDTITVGAEAGSALLDQQGTLVAVVINTTAAGTVTLADSSGSFAVLKSSIAEGTYYYWCDVGSFLQVTLGAASDVTVIYSSLTPNSMAV